MRQFTAGAALDLDGRGRLRLRLWNPTGEEVFHDLSPAAADAMRETLNAAEAARAAKAEQAAKDAAAAERAALDAASKTARSSKPKKRRSSGKET